jgi:hypothetical protein
MRLFIVISSVEVVSVTGDEIAAIVQRDLVGHLGYYPADAVNAVEVALHLSCHG